MSKLRRVGIASGVVVLLLAIAAAALAYAFFHTFYPTPPEPHYPPAADAAEAQRQDLDYFRRYLDLNRSYTPAAREQASHLLAEDTAKAGTFTPAQFDLAVSRIVALADNGHSRVHPELHPEELVAGEARDHAGAAQAVLQPRPHAP